MLWSIMRYIFSTLLLFFLNLPLKYLITLVALIWSTAAMSLEEPEYTILKQTVEYEIRKYGDRLASKVAANAYRLEKTFKNYGALSRKQIQWSLKKRGYYKSSIDGLWGTGTKNAVVRFAQDKGLDAFYSGEVYDEVSRGLNVPSSFAVAKKQPKPSQNSGGSSNALGIFLLLGALCSLTPDAAACISGARK